MSPAQSKGLGGAPTSRKVRVNRVALSRTKDRNSFDPVFGRYIDGRDEAPRLGNK